MQVIIFTSLKDRNILQQIMNWGSKSTITFQMFFTKDLKFIKRILKDNDKLIITTEPALHRILKEAGHKVVLVQNEWTGIKYEL